MYKIFPYIYALAISSTFGFGQIEIPGLPFNFGQICYIMLLILCFFINRKILFDKYICLYAIFLFFFFASSVLTGFHNTFVTFFVNKLFTLVPIYWGTKILATRNENLYPLLIPILVIGFFDSLVTIFQVYRIPIFNSFTDFLGVVDQEKVEMMERRNITFGLSMNGIYSSPVHNGHNLLFFFCMSFMLIERKLNLIRLLPSFFILAGIFFCQQRSAFLVAILAILVFLHFLVKKRMIKKRYIVLFCTIAFLIIASNFSINITGISDSRLSDINLSDRTTLFADAIAYISDNIIIGGVYQFTQIYGMPPHNVILSAFMAGGIIGGTILISMMISQFLYIVNLLKYKYSFKYLVISVAFFAMILDSMTHNTGYVQGDYATFIAWGLILALYKR